MRALLAAVALGTGFAALWPFDEAKAWWDVYGLWHPNFYRPYYAPPPPVDYAPPARRWIPPHYDPWGRFIPGHWR